MKAFSKHLQHLHSTTVYFQFNIKEATTLTILKEMQLYSAKNYFSFQFLLCVTLSFITSLYEFLSMMCACVCACVCVCFIYIFNPYYASMHFKLLCFCAVSQRKS